MKRIAGPLRRLLARRLVIPFVVRRDESRLARLAPSDEPACVTGLPVPPPLLRVLVAGTGGGDWFLKSGEAQGKFILDLAGQFGVSLDRPLAVLDFGCGCGRLARWIAPSVEAAGGAFTGSDLNPRLARWCARNLPGKYLRNRLLPPLGVPDGSQDLVYSYSVVTHLSLPSTRAWISELARVTKPGGLVLISFHDEDFRPGPVLEPLLRDGHASTTDLLEGANYMASYATREFFADMCRTAFEVLDIRPSDLSRDLQAWAVLRRPVAPA